jgi:hypothetical protein
MVMVDQHRSTISHGESHDFHPITGSPNNAAVWSAWRAKQHLHRGRGRLCAAPHLGAGAAAMLGDE